MPYPSIYSSFMQFLLRESTCWRQWSSCRDVKVESHLSALAGVDLDGWTMPVARVVIEVAALDKQSLNRLDSKVTPRPG